MAAGAKEERTMRWRLRQLPLARRKGLGLGSEVIRVREGEVMADEDLLGWWWWWWRCPGRSVVEIGEDVAAPCPGVLAGPRPSKWATTGPIFIFTQIGPTYNMFGPKTSFDPYATWLAKGHLKSILSLVHKFKLLHMNLSLSGI